ncbi:MAG TPA: NAD(P)-dependent oxidoreductase [Steroidobacteraceae bacterium]|nr:NAD(P)-dependent oxidoreductase [Steroidobacteraceae bacterium]
MKVFLTGGTGFIGSQLAPYARNAGHDITVASPINNATEKFRCDLLRRAGLTVVEAALDDTERLRAVLPGHDAIIHLAAAQHEAEAPESHFRKVNVEGTHNLLTLAVECGVPRFVHGSTIGVYGNASNGVLDETSPLAPDNPYGRTKAEAERVVQGFRERIETVIVRISETYGPADLRLLKLFKAIRKGRYVTLGNGRNERQLIYVEDLCRALLAAAQSREAVGQTIILAGNERLTTDQMIAAISAALGKPPITRHIPLWPFDVAAAVCETCLPPLGLKPPLHRRRLDFFRKSFRFSTERAARVLDFSPQVPFTDGARRTAQWYREKGLLS